MIIFNIWAILVAAIIAVLVLGMKSVFPALIDSHYGDLIIALAVAIVGGAAEFFGIRGRVFFIPIWLLGIGAVAYAAYTLWGIAGVIAPVVVFFLALWWMNKASDKREAERWSKAPVALSELKARHENADAVAFWKLVQNSLFLPIGGTYSPAMCAHNLEVTKIVLARESKLLAPKELAAWNSLESYMQENQGRDKPKRLDYDVHRFLVDFIESKTTPLKGNTTKPVLSQGKG